MANETTELRDANPEQTKALSAALAAPEFVSRSMGLARHLTDRHVERWAPESNPRLRGMRSLAFVDRLVTPWLDAAQRSASLRLFQNYRPNASLGREAAVSWVFPRPWYQDELDWLAAAQQAAEAEQHGARRPSTMLTTRGTYIAPQQPAPRAIPAALYEYVAPSLSIAPAVATENRRAERTSRDVYSPLVPLAAVEAVRLAARLAPMAMPAALPPAIAARVAPTAPTSPVGSLLSLRSMLAQVVERAALASTDPALEAPTTRLAQQAPELVTPPAPRPGDAVAASAQVAATRPAAAPAELQIAQIARVAAEQRAALAELARVSRAAMAIPAATTAPSVAAPVAPIAPDAPVVSTDASATPATAPVAATFASIDGPSSALVSALAPTASSEALEASTSQSTNERAEAAPVPAAQVAADVRAQVQQAVEATIAERTAQRATATLHEQARAEAAAHARPQAQAALTAEATAASAPASSLASSTPSVAAPTALPPAVLAAIAALPPELARMVVAAGVVGERIEPQRALAALDQLTEQLRVTELLARGAVAGRPLEVTRGPRLVMPAGLGGLVATLEGAPALGASGARDLAPRSMLGLAPTADGTAEAAVAPVRGVSRASALRAPAMPWVASPTIASTSAFGATAAAAPQTLAHVAWADRWLARFAGASTQSLDMLSATGATATSTGRMTALAGAAPDAIFVAPRFDAERATPTRVDEYGRVTRGNQVLPAPLNAPITGPVRIERAPLAPVSVERFDDNAATPDDVFTAIAASASKRRAAPRPAMPVTSAGAPASALPSSSSSSSSSSPAAAASTTTASITTQTYADRVAHAAPSAPGAGLSAQLAASPFATALQHIIPLASARTFDVRALFAPELASTFLAGLLAPSTQTVAAAAPTPAWAHALATATDATELAPMLRALGFEATYVAPEAPTATPARAGEVRRPGVAPVTSSSVASPSASPVAQPTRRDDGRATAAITTLRSALLSIEAEIPGSPALAPTARTSDVASTTSAAPTAIAASATSTSLAMPAVASPMAAFAPLAHDRDAIAQPMLGDRGDELAPTWTVPGAVGSRAHAWSVAQERSAADLAFDFVTPELVLAARVYGFGPAEAVQAARLAIAGPTQLAAMANAVDRTFVQAMAREVERHRAVIATAYPSSSAAAAAASSRASATPATAPSTSTPAIGDASAPATSTSLTSSTSSTSPTSTSTPTRVTSAPGATEGLGSIGGVNAPIGMPSSTFGVGRRTPRGAFLWPSAAVAALGLDAALPDGALGTTIAALELLAAHAVTDLGTYAALADIAKPDAHADAAITEAFVETRRATREAQARALTPTSTTSSTTATAASFVAPTANEHDVLETVSALVPHARRARFDALYVALGRSSVGQGWSPAARAARAFALVGRGEDGTVSSSERVATVWDVLPVIYALGDRAAANDGTTTPRTASTATVRDRAPAMTPLASNATTSSSSFGGFAGRRPARGPANDLEVVVDPRPGLGGLASRAGEAISSYVTPHQASAMMSTSDSATRTERQAARAAASVAPEYVRSPARPSAKAGGGEAEIPAWFEQAARRMFAEQTGVAESISLTELTLIQQAPPSAVAASTRSLHGPAPSISSSSSGGGSGHDTGHHDVDVDGVANEIYQQILDMMQSARARNGEPFL